MTDFIDIYTCSRDFDVHSQNPAISFQSQDCELYLALYLLLL